MHKATPLVRNKTISRNDNAMDNLYISIRKEKISIRDLKNDDNYVCAIGEITSSDA